MSLLRNVLASCLLSLSFISTVAFAETTGPQNVEEVICEYNNNCYVKMHIPAQVNPKCASNRFVFEAGSKSGKNILALLSMAFLAKAKVNVSFYYCNGTDYSLAYVTLSN